MLGGLGLSPVEEDVYLHLVDRGEATTAALGAALAHPADAIAEALAALARHGLVSTAPDEPGRHVVGPPTVTLGSLLAARRDVLHQAELAITELAERHRAAAGRDLGGLIEIVTGVQPISRRFLQVLESADREICGFTKSPPVAVGPRDNPAEPVVAGRGLRMRTVIEQSYLADPHSGVDIDQALGRGQEIAIAAELPVSMVIADSSIALVPAFADPQDTPRAILINSSGLLSPLVALFEKTWAAAYPLRPRTVRDGDPIPYADGTPGPAGLAPLDAKILDLLLAGLTDRAVAGTLGVSLRTVTRRIRHLMDLAGADNRIQLGWRATQRGWI
ncbi:helix-turn-helix domain-containing protein [Streptomyces sp. NBC_01485]|uniref:helix-turn-helix domain-containing protein n=1 Tax=Streptomyces sp. NBC_01485 TaxID=2903884 RepID=UPI002E38081E|nr:helix-turn-helix domain-containing protein [Streptomyces sp. NBC_01485]